MDAIERAATQHPKLARNRVWCRKCETTYGVDSAECLRHGGPNCCGLTVTIDSPAERCQHLAHKLRQLLEESGLRATITLTVGRGAERYCVMLSAGKDPPPPAQLLELVERGLVVQLPLMPARPPAATEAGQ